VESAVSLSSRCGPFRDDALMAMGIYLAWETASPSTTTPARSRRADAGDEHERAKQMEERALLQLLCSVDVRYASRRAFAG
jgi:hypothetical protein